MQSSRYLYNGDYGFYCLSWFYLQGFLSVLSNYILELHQYMWKWVWENGTDQEMYLVHFCLGCLVVCLYCFWATAQMWLDAHVSVQTWMTITIERRQQGAGFRSTMLGGPHPLMLSQGMPLQDPPTKNIATKSVVCWLVLWEPCHWLHITCIIDPLVQKGAQMNPFSKWLSYTKYHNMTGDSVNRIWVTKEPFSMECEKLYKLDSFLQRNFNTWY